MKNDKTRMNRWKALRKGHPFGAKPYISFRLHYGSLLSPPLRSNGRHI